MYSFSLSKILNYFKNPRGWSSGPTALYKACLENYKEIFQTSDNNKFNKNLILLSLREMTNLSTKEIRTSMKKYKILLIFILVSFLLVIISNVAMMFLIIKNNESLQNYQV